MINNNNNNKNGKWQFAFWIITIGAVLILSFFGNAIINNDRLRAAEDRRIENRVNSFKDCIGDKLNDIVERLARIEAKVERNGN